MDLMKMASALLAEKMNDGSAAQSDLLQGVLGNLLGGSSNSGLDLGSLLGKLNDSGLQDKAASWLGDGQNADISIDQIQELLGSEKVAEAAQQLGAQKEDLLGGLQHLLPNLIDKSSQGGSLLDSVGGIGGLAGLASKFLK